jgi:hypothetical protein
MTTYRRTRKTYPPGVLAIYDNRGRTIDRYTVVFAPEDGFFPVLHLSEHPSSPRGVGMRGECDRRPKPGPRDRAIDLADLPPDCRRVVEEELNPPKEQNQ